MLAADDDPILGDEAFGVRLIATFGATIKTTAKIILQEAKKPRFLCSLIFDDSNFRRRFRQTGPDSTEAAAWQARPSLQSPRFFSLDAANDLLISAQHVIPSEASHVERSTFLKGVDSCYALYRSRFLCRFAFMRLRRLCLAIFALRLFLREPIQIFFKFASSDSTIRCAAMQPSSHIAR